MNRWDRFTFHDNRDLQRTNARIGRRRTRRSLRRLLPRGVASLIGGR